MIKRRMTSNLFSAISVILYLIAIAKHFEVISAFTFCPTFNTAQFQRGQVQRTSPINVRLSWLEEDDQSSTTSLISKISTSDENTSTLARLAVAFSPPERQISLKDIEQVYVVNVDGEHIEIVAEICEQDRCVTLFVPVQFPKYCESDGMEECVLDNLHMLEEEAKLKLKEMTEIEQTDDEEDNFLCSVLNDLPNWWVRPEYNSPLIDECDMMRKMLNEIDFQSDMNELATRGLADIEGGEMVVVAKAKVCAVGPSGLMFRARVMSNVGDNVWIIEIPYRFDGVALDVQSMRGYVLGAVAEISR